MKASFWLFANSHLTQKVIIWAILGGAHRSKRGNMTRMIGKMYFKGEIALGSKHVKGYFIGGLFA